LKKSLLILSFLLITTFATEAQVKLASPVNIGAQNPIVRFYPNPASAQITFDFQHSYEKGYSLQVYNFLGRKMIEQNNVSDKTTINLTEFNRGVYIYKLFDKSGRLVETGKFQVSK
jgi:hypothetical protein